MTGSLCPRKPVSSSSPPVLSWLLGTSRPAVPLLAELQLSPGP